MMLSDTLPKHELVSVPLFSELNDTLSTMALDASAATPVLPEELTFTRKSLVQVIVYVVLFVAAAAGNVPVFVSLLGKRARKSRIKLMMMHLAVADLIVTFVMIPLEVAWRLTVCWVAGNAMCKIMQILRAFGPYLSSMVLVCISADRYFAVLHPLRVHDARRRGKFMLAAAWYISLACSLPQALIFRVMEHPEVPGFWQCVTFSSFPSPLHETLYNLFCLLVLYGIPLGAIILAYGRILCEMHRQAKDSRAQEPGVADAAPCARLRLRCSDMRRMQRAQYRTLRLTVVIVLAFFLCWTPYVVMVLWYQLDAESAKHVDDYLQSSLFMFAVSNSCVNPLVYGSYTGRLNVGRCFSSRCYPADAVPEEDNRRFSSSLRRFSKRTLQSWFPRTVAPATAVVDPNAEYGDPRAQRCSLCVADAKGMCVFSVDVPCIHDERVSEARSAQVNGIALNGLASAYDTPLRKNHSL
ncbi:adipokinetic hormone/corazonin-related peptide receptor variant I-like [Rhipicephalus sanguineus]|uniref:adipokinetic hormone/corazonin-related peptide receptor variant I-like n=1 Tax=Rhipicephalus sanguineus TaxID=34632 RepID=UPI00189335BE|nr:adipokinetic hormone/corazonin-related peptide receptor variant I-like [Rhipicephalus sanguineus]